jgi:hypothetical protein
MDELDELSAANEHFLNRISALRFQVDRDYAPSQIHSTLTQVILAEKAYRVAWKNAHEEVR